MRSESLDAKLCLAAGETPCFPIIDSSIASPSLSFSNTAFPVSGILPSFEKLICA
ncbi:hypothetical protein Hanom_Chr06g00578121 [Helianthus anomalus]